MNPADNSSSLDHHLAYAVLRITLGVNIAVHGAGRIFGAGAAAFAAEVAKLFVDTPLPASMVHMFLWVLPYAEFALGVLITLGLFTRWALTLGGLLIAALVFGTALRSDWTNVAIQMLYVIVYYFLLRNRAENVIALDTLWGGRRNP
jgi:thiosulfate dehydrogenase [quinone] large subunit